MKRIGFGHKEVLPTILVLAASCSLYLSTLAPGMLRGDSGEFQWAMASRSVAHATGYPLFTLLGSAWLTLPLPGEAAWRLNLIGALSGALAVTTLFALVSSITKRIDAALVSALFFALTPVLWFNSSILEVYPLHAFLLSLTLYLFWRWSLRIEEGTFLYAAFLVLGLSLAHHRLAVLALPAVGVFLFLSDRHFFGNIRRLALCLALLVPGFLMYLYIPLRMLPEGYSLEYVFFDIILGREYAGSLVRELNATKVLWEIPITNFGLGLPLAAIGAISLLRRARNLGILLFLVWVTDVLFALVYSVPDIEVFLTSAIVVIAVWIGAGAASILDWVAERIKGERGARAARVALLLIVLLALWGFVNYSSVQNAVAAEAGTVEARARAILAANYADGARLELDWETATGVRFLQAIEKARTDLQPNLIELYNRDKFWAAIRDVNNGKSVFVEPGIEWRRSPAGYELKEANGMLAQLVRLPSVSRDLSHRFSDEVEMIGYSVEPDQLIILWKVQKPIGKDLSTFVHYLDANGEKVGQDDHAACCQPVYGYRTSEWEPGRVYADRFLPPPSQAIAMLVGMYQLVNEEIEPFGEPITVELGD